MRSTDLELPQSLDAITASWLTQALERGGLEGATVEDFDVQTLGEGEGFMGRLARVQLRYSGNGCSGPTELIAKLPTDDPGGRVMGQMLGLWERESRFYDEVAPHIELRVPRCYFNGVYEEDHLLLLEDLAPWVTADQVAGCSEAQARRVIEEIGGFHAAWWNDPRLESFDWMPRVDGPLAGAVVPMFENSWGAFRDRYAEQVDPRTLKWAENFVAQVPEWLASYGDEPCSITHGDFRLDNMLFGPGGELALVDWQMSMCSPPNSDVVYLLSTNMDSEIRRACEDDLLRHYREQLLLGGVPEADVTEEKITRGYNEGLVFYCVMMASGLETIDPANERGAALLDTLVRRAYSAAADRNAGELIGL